MSCESNLNKDKSDNINFAPKLSASDIGKDIPGKFEVYRLLPVNFDHDPVIEYLAIIRPKPDLNSVVEPIGNVYINLYNYDEKWEKLDSLNLGKPFIKEEFSITDIDSNNINEILLEGWYMYANGEQESEVFVITVQGGDMQNACEYIESYHDLIFDRETGVINAIDWLEGDDLNGDGVPDDSGYWNCHYLKCIKYELVNGRFIPTQEIKSKRKYTFDNKYGKCDFYTIESIKREFGIR